MARLLDVSDQYANYGYFYTSIYEEVIEYLRLLRLRNESFLVTIHSSGLFTNIDGEEVELHMPSHGPFMFDPDMVDFDELVDGIYEQCTCPENYESMAGSGYTLIPGTFTFWINAIKYQPNNTPDDNSWNTHTPATSPSPSFDDYSSEEEITTNEGTLTDTFLIALAAYHVEKTHDSRLIYHRKLERWVKQHNLWPQGGRRINISTLAEWHNNQRLYHIRVFSGCGNVIYHRYFDEEPCIDILWKNKKFKLITNLWSLLKEKHDRVFCDICKKFHSRERLCQPEVCSPETTNIEAPDIPRGRHGLVIYADFESIIKPDKSHEASGYSYIALDEYHEVIKSEIVDATSGRNICERFVNSVIDFLTEYTSMNVYPTSDCKICGQILDKKDQIIVGRNYISGSIGSHHVNCWRDSKNTAYIFFHNFRGYDSHYVLREVMRLSTIHTIRGKSFEKFDLINCVTNDKARFCFKDTFNFFSTSLSKLTSTISNWRYTPEEARSGKGVFPYDWFDNFDKLMFTELPPRAEWYNKLTNTLIDASEAYDIWDSKNFTYFREYHNYYMHIDVLQLADCFEEFRDACISKFDTDPVYCQGAPALTWQLALQNYSHLMHSIHEMDVYLDIQKNIRGGVSQVMHRYLDVDEGEILYLDINSLYSTCMMEKLPGKYLMKVEGIPPNWENYADKNGSHCAIMCVDLIYPEHLHDDHMMYPLAPHKFNNRLCATLLPKENYLISAENLKFYLDKGLILEKCHYTYIFEQDYILSAYVTNNINERRKTKNPILQTLYKLLNNSLYGKTCENKFKYKKYHVKKIVEGERGKTNPFLYKAKNWLQIEDNLLCEDQPGKIVLDKPIQLGFIILEKAKLKMYEFAYLIMKHYKNKCKFLYTDTDSLMIYFNFSCPQNSLFANEEIFPYLDFDSVPDDWTVKTEGTDKQSGLWSLETHKKIKTFCGLRAKTYAVKFQDNTEMIKNKGIVASATEINLGRKITFKDYETALFENKEIYVLQTLIRSKNHSLSHFEQKKLALSCIDEKRAILEDKITSIPFGYRGEQFKHMNTLLESVDLL